MQLVTQLVILARLAHSPHHLNSAPATTPLLELHGSLPQDPPLLFSLLLLPGQLWLSLPPLPPLRLWLSLPRLLLLSPLLLPLLLSLPLLPQRPSSLLPRPQQLLLL